MPGHGKVQRLVLAILRQHERKRSAKERAKGLDESLLMRMAHRKRLLNYPIASREKMSVRSALKALAREGAVLDLGTPQGSHSPLAHQPPEFAGAAAPEAAAHGHQETRHASPLPAALDDPPRVIFPFSLGLARSS